MFKRIIALLLMITVISSMSVSASAVSIPDMWMTTNSICIMKDKAISRIQFELDDCGIFGLEYTFNKNNKVKSVDLTYKPYSDPYYKLNTTSKLSYLATYITGYKTASDSFYDEDTNTYYLTLSTKYRNKCNSLKVTKHDINAFINTKLRKLAGTRVSRYYKAFAPEVFKGLAEDLPTIQQKNITVAKDGETLEIEMKKKNTPYVVYVYANEDTVINTQAWAKSYDGVGVVTIFEGKLVGHGNKSVDYDNLTTYRTGTPLGYGKRVKSSYIPIGLQYFNYSIDFKYNQLYKSLYTNVDELSTTETHQRESMVKQTITLHKGDCYQFTFMSTKAHDVIRFKVTSSVKGAIGENVNSVPKPVKSVAVPNIN